MSKCDCSVMPIEGGPTPEERLTAERDSARDLCVSLEGEVARQKAEVERRLAEMMSLWGALSKIAARPSGGTSRADEIIWEAREALGADRAALGEDGEER